MSSRPRNRSCAACHSRKVRCDKKVPCSQCVHSDFACSYPPPTAAPTRRKKSTRIDDVASRIAQMEQTINSLKAARLPPLAAVFENPPTPVKTAPSPAGTYAKSREGLLFNKGTSSHYVNEVLLTRAIEQEDDVRIALATPSNESPRDVNAPICHLNPMAWMSGEASQASVPALHPQRRVAIWLWKVFVESVDTYAKVTHLPTTETTVYTVANNPASASREDLALCFAIYFASITALSPKEVLAITGEDATQALQRYRMCLEQSVAQADFLDNPTVIILQALAIYMAAMRAHSSGQAVWIINGLAIRSAQSIGLHKDGMKLGLSPFESEIRRRLWWHLRDRGGREAEDYGLQNPSGVSAIHGAEMPRNLHDSDIFPGMKELPPSRPEWTRMTLSLCSNRVSQGWTQLSQVACSADCLLDEGIQKQIIRETAEKIHDTLERCNPVIPEQRMTIQVARLILGKLNVISRRQWQILCSPDDREQMALESEITEAVELLELSNSIWQDDDLVAFRWTISAFPQYHILLFILRHLCVFPQGELARRAFAAVELHFENLKTTRTGSQNGVKWTVLTTLRDRAFSLLHNYGSSQQISPCEVQNGEEAAVQDWNTVLEEFPLDMGEFPFL